MPGGPSVLHERDREEHAKDAYAATARLLMHILDLSREAVDVWSSRVEAAGDKAAYEVAAKGLTSSIVRKAMAANLLAACCIDSKGRFDMAPGTWREVIAAWAEGMASLAGLAAARGWAEGSPSSEATNAPVLTEIAISDSWIRFAANVVSTEKSAAGTVLGAMPVDEMAAMAARMAEIRERQRWAEVEQGGGCGGPIGAAMASRMRAAKVGRQAADDVGRLAEGAAKQAAAARMGAASVWAKTSAIWSEVHDRAVKSGDDAAADLVAAWIRSADGNAERLRAV